MAAYRYQLLTGLLLVGLSAVLVEPFSKQAIGTPPVQNLPKNVQKQQIGSRIDGVVLMIGTEHRKGDPAIEAGRKVEVKVGKEVRTFRCLKEGDIVERGQMVAQLDDKAARLALQAAETGLRKAQEEFVAAVATTKRSQQRLDRLRGLLGKGAVTEKEYSEGKLARDKDRQEENQKREAVNLARQELEAAQITLEWLTVRSRVRGVIRAIHKNPGEGVKALETLLEIEAVEKK